LHACAGLNGVSQQDGKLDNVAKASTDATLKAAQNITPDLSELPNARDLPNPFDSTGFADKVRMPLSLFSFFLFFYYKRAQVPGTACTCNTC
jgi:hypothetical protein